MLPPEDLRYLESKGALSLPPQPLCEHFLLSYFQHVQPLTPVLNTKDFLKLYGSEFPQKPSLLLLYSIFFAAANVSENTPKTQLLKVSWISQSLQNRPPWKPLAILPERR
jgi:hypothetical protein